MNSSSCAEKSNGFTLVEMLVSLAILAILLLVLAQANSALSLAIKQTTSQEREFQSARDAFEAMTRRISQATLNSYDDTAAYTSLTVPGYARASELRFISGPASLNATALNRISGTLFNSTNPYHPTHAIFFQAPLGKTGGAPADLMKALNTCGYYLEWNTDTAAGLGIVPSIISPANYTPRYRYRLMEMTEPSDALSIYSHTSGTLTGSPAANGNPTYYSVSWTYNARDWFRTPLGNPAYAHAMAENVVLLCFLPMVAPEVAQNPPGGAADGTSLDIAPNYIYDSAPPTSGTPPVSMNQLPPMVFVEMIAVDETSFSAYQARRSNPSSVPSDLGIDSGSGSILTDATYSTRQSDIETVTNALQAAHLKYRTFSTIVPLSAH
jgi:uncharacterized protein (TIGR02599 family)